MTGTPPLNPRTEDDIRTELDRPGPAHLTRNEIKALLAELDRLRAANSRQSAPSTNTERTPRAELYRALVTGGTFIRRPGLTHADQADAAIDAVEKAALAAVAARVAALPTANDGQLIAADRQQILDAITGP
ncbi:hypothetical protein [Kitasatospora viridis]|uniref:Uncharacterized protein n=1 Tax=Kitasatospora viridis TaxID=281105 RepID=A0A561UKP1_9ACTN|nr:hypothetical protein [Kitasatospora viridis]TWF99930.1 hypothetical protein FHX73_113790 [Kitasatospora viridis]